MPEDKSEFKVLMRLIDAYRLSEDIFSDSLKRAVLREIQNRGAFIKAGNVHYENVRIKL